jgi:hypothetical protein
VFNSQIPGKVYEYLATGKPIMLKTPDNSATANVVTDYNGVYIAYDKDSLLRQLYVIFTHINQNIISKDPMNRFPCVQKHSRKNHSVKLLKKISKINGL